MGPWELFQVRVGWMPGEAAKSEQYVLIWKQRLWVPQTQETFKVAGHNRNFQPCHLSLYQLLWPIWTTPAPGIYMLVSFIFHTTLLASTPPSLPSSQGSKFGLIPLPGSLPRPLLSPIASPSSGLLKCLLSVPLNGAQECHKVACNFPCVLSSPTHIFYKHLWKSDSVLPVFMEWKLSYS